MSIGKLIASTSFQNNLIDVIDDKGNRWADMKQIATALGYKDHRQLLRLIDRHSEDFKSRESVVVLTTQKGERITRVLNAFGVIRAAMLSKAPLAIEFRNWAETVLFKVMTEGAYIHTEDQYIENIVSKVLKKVTPIISQMIDGKDTVKQLEESLYSDKWMTATEAIRMIVYPKEIPPRFNAGGNFDSRVAEIYVRVFGHAPKKRYPPKYSENSQSEWVYKKNNQSYDFIMKIFSQIKGERHGEEDSKKRQRTRRTQRRKRRYSRNCF